MWRPFFIIAAFIGVLNFSNAIPLGNLRFAKNNEIKDTDPEYRINSKFEPLRYDLSIDSINFDVADAAKKFTFEGTVNIQLKPLEKDLKSIKLHAKDLTIENKDVSLKNSNGEAVTVKDIAFNKTYDFFFINVDDAKPLDQKLDYTVTIKYTARLRDDMTGFYKSYYKEGDTIKWMGTTQFQSIFARRAFPCLDEPQYKSVFSLKITRAKSMAKSLSNMPIIATEMGADFVTETFEDTPKMSTYLLAFIVSEFTSPEINSDKPFGVWGRPAAQEQSKYALDIGAKIVDEMSKYMKIDYYEMSPDLKMDQAAIPDFSAGAMENWGLLTYREAYLMHHENETNIRYKQSISTILAHEIAHQWFGDLVTCEWWSYTWLNEGFASFFEYRLPDMAGDNYDLEDQFILNQFQRALLADAEESSPPMSNENINSLAEIEAHFGVITYQKGASVITMIENLIEKETFQKGLNAYIESRKFQTTKPQYLFDKLQEAADKDKTLEKLGVKVEDVMKSFTEQSGYPVINVNVDMASGNVTLTQERFHKLGQDRNDTTLYVIPISYTTDKELLFNETKPTLIMDEKTMEFNKGSKDHGYVILNIQAKNYYRVNYDQHTWEMIRGDLMKKRESIHRYNRAQMVDDLFNLAFEGYIEYNLLFSMLEFLENETEYLPWSTAYNGFATLASKFAHEKEAIRLLEERWTRLMKNVLNDLKVEEDSEDSNLRKLFRSKTLVRACQLNNADCLKSAKDYFKLWKDGNITGVPPNLREHVYCNALRQGDGEDYDFLWEMHETSNVVNEQLVIMTALGCTKDAEKLEHFLNQTLDEMTIRSQDQVNAYIAALSGNQENADVVLEYVKKRYPDMKEAYSNPSVIIPLLATQLSKEKLEDLDKFIEGADKEIISADEKKAYHAVVERSQENIKWASDNQDKLVKALRGSASTMAVSFTLLLFTFFVSYYNNKM